MEIIVFSFVSVNGSYHTQIVMVMIRDLLSGGPAILLATCEVWYMSTLDTKQKPKPCTYIGDQLLPSIGFICLWLDNVPWKLLIKLDGTGT